MFRRTFLGSAASALAVAQTDPNSLSPAEQKAGWKLLFDGKTFDGWDDPARRNPSAKAWRIADGCIQSIARPNIREDLLTVEKFQDFEVVFEWRVAPGSNSGFKYLVQDRVMIDYGIRPKDIGKFENHLRWEMINRKSDRAHLVGQGEEYNVAFEYQVIDDSKHEDAQRGPKYQAGSLYSLVGAAKPAARPVGEFNAARIVKKGLHVEHWLNGVKVVDTSLQAEGIRKSLESRWTTDHPVYELLTRLPARATPLCLQNHNDDAWFRAIKIRKR